MSWPTKRLSACPSLPVGVQQKLPYLRVETVLGKQSVKNSVLCGTKTVSLGDWPPYLSEDRSEDGSCAIRRNVLGWKRKDAAPQLRSLRPSVAPLWEPEMSRSAVSAQCCALGSLRLRMRNEDWTHSAHTLLYYIETNWKRTCTTEQQNWLIQSYIAAFSKERSPIFYGEQTGCHYLEMVLSNRNSIRKDVKDRQIQGRFATIRYVRRPGAHCSASSLAHTSRQHVT
jgi:hypothetical protein